MKTIRGGRTLAAVAALALSVPAVAAAGGPTARTAAQSITKADIATGQKYAAPKHVRKGVAKRANPKLAPLRIGFSLQLGGTLGFPEFRASASSAVSFINNYLGGIDGHPLRLNTCFMQTEEDGQRCGAQFLQQKVPMVEEALAVIGNASLHNTLGGKIPQLIPQGANPTDPDATNAYIYDPGASAVIQAQAAQAIRLKAKSVAILGADNPAGRGAATIVQATLKAKGIASKAAFTSQTATTPDFVSALQAAGGTSADVLMLYPGTPAQCLQIYNAIQQLGIAKKAKVISSFAQCTADVVLQGTKGAPEGWYLIGSVVSPRVSTPDTTAYKDVMEQYGKETFIYASNSIRVFTDLLILAHAGNELGFKKITPTSLARAFKSYKGDAFGSPGPFACGKSRAPSTRAVCGRYAVGAVVKNHKFVPIPRIRIPTF
jgi:branched-chain amino acid transport system substrate-binding protein